MTYAELYRLDSGWYYYSIDGGEEFLCGADNNYLFALNLMYDMGYQLISSFSRGGTRYYILIHKGA
jgi:hypothetical protein